MMDNTMLLKLIAFESLGVRSQATYIQTNNALIFIDPSAALAPRRYGLPPHKIEALRLLEVFRDINSFIQDSEHIIITHYHYDHHDPGVFVDVNLYKDKVFLIKDPQNNINFSQKIRANRFLNIIKDKSKDIKVIDGKIINFGETQLVFSQPLPHGESNKLGYVISLCIKDKDYAVLFTSDIEGGPLKEHLQIIKMCSPRIAIIDGPPTYLLDYKYSRESFKRSLNFLKSFSEIPDLEIIILDHHICRELNYLNKINKIIEEFNVIGKRILNAANFMGVDTQFLEALRKELYNKEPVNGIDILKSYKKIYIEGMGEE
jgi:predicted metallo-beta-lactamase superfamily hydrolase